MGAPRDCGLWAGIVTMLRAGSVKHTGLQRPVVAVSYHADGYRVGDVELTGKALDGARPGDRKIRTACKCHGWNSRARG